MKFFKKLMHFFSLFFAFSTTKHCDRLDWDEKDAGRTVVKDLEK